MNESMEHLLANLVRIGTVSSVDAAARRVRVIYRDKDDMISGWLPVLQHSGGAVDIVPDGEHTHSITDTFMGGGSASVEPSHSHEGSATGAWMPKVNDTVLVLYLPVFNADGFVLGAI